MCGDDEMSWNNNRECVRAFVRAMKLASISPAWSEAGFQEINMDGFISLLELQLSQTYSAEELPSPDLLDIAYAMRHKQATDRRDMIYALLNLREGNTIRDEFHPDYRKSVHELYDDLIKILAKDNWTPSE